MYWQSEKQLENLKTENKPKDHLAEKKKSPSH